jgi:hypothetical protein
MSVGWLVCWMARTEESLSMHAQVVPANHGGAGGVAGGSDTTDQAKNPEGGCDVHTYLFGGLGMGATRFWISGPPPAGATMRARPDRPDAMFGLDHTWCQTAAKQVPCQGRPVLLGARNEQEKIIPTIKFSSGCHRNVTRLQAGRAYRSQNPLSEGRWQRPGHVCHRDVNLQGSDSQARDARRLR